MRTAVLAALVLASGCVADVDSLENASDTDASGIQFSEAALSNNELTAYNFFVSKGLTKIQSAAIVGNLMQESSVIPTSVEYGGGPGRGIAQWSTGGRWDSSHNDNVTSYASQHGVSRTQLGTQLDFIWYELTTYSQYGLASLKAATTVSSAVYAFQAKYEICGTCDATKRNQYANQVLASYGGSSGGGSTPAPAGDECYSNTLGMNMPDNACVQSKSDDLWYQCSNGMWVDRWSDPTACNGVHPL
jgi:hypothetical protein